MVYVSSPPVKKPIQQPVMRSKNIELEHLKYSTLPNMQKRQSIVDHPLQGSDDRLRTASLPRKSGSLRKMTANDLREKAIKAAKNAAAASNQHEIVRDSSISDGYLEDVGI